MARHFLFVLGMHRSGTSALTGALAKSGAAPGAHLMPPTNDNPEGYWECAPVVRLNDELLKRMGSRWDSVLALSGDWLSQPSVESLRREAADIVAAEFGDARFAVLKDPRLCRLLPFWRDIVVTAGYAPSAMLMVRRPMEVAASLARRDQFAPEKSLALWFEHLVDAERNSRDVPRATIAYDALLADAADTLARVCDDAAFPLKPSPAQRKAAGDLVRPDLKRQHHEAPKRAARESLASGLDTVLDAGYARIAELPPGRDPQAAVTALAHSAHAALAAAMPPWLAQELAATQAAASERATEVETIRRNMRELEAHVEAARSAHKARDEIEAALRARTDELALTRADLASIRESVKAEIVSINTTGIGTAERELRDHVARLQKELGDERATIARLAEQIDQARLGATNQELQIEAARRQIEEFIGQIEFARQSHAARDEQEAALQQQLDATHQELSTLGAEFNEIRIERDEMARKLQTLEGQLVESAAHARSLAQQLDAAASKLARLDARWLGRLARRVAQA